MRYYAITVSLLLALLLSAIPAFPAGSGDEAGERARLQSVLEHLPPMLAEYRFPLAESAKGALDAGASAHVVVGLIKRAVMEKVDFLSLSKFLAVLTSCARQGLPVERISDKIHEGLSKKIPPPRIAMVIERFEKRLSRAKGLADILVRRNLVPASRLYTDRLVLSIDYALLQGAQETELEELFSKVEPAGDPGRPARLEEAPGVYTDLRRVGLSQGQAKRILTNALEHGEGEDLEKLGEVARGAADEGDINPEELRSKVDRELAKGARTGDIAKLLSERTGRPAEHERRK